MQVNYIFKFIDKEDYLMIPKKGILVILILISIFLGACSTQLSEPITPNATPTQLPNLEQVSKQLDAMQSQWQSQGLDNYQFQFQWACFCPAEYREPVWVTVEEGEITSIQAVDQNLESGLPENDEYLTINELFEFIRDGVEKDAYEINVTYDDALGFPTSVQIDYDVAIEDEEHGFNILEFEKEIATPAETLRPNAFNPEITLSPTSGPPGTEIEIVAEGLPPNIMVQLGIGRVNSEYDLLSEGQTDAQGSLTANLSVPDYIGPTDNIVVVIITADQEIKAISNVFNVTQLQTAQPAISIQPDSGLPGTTVEVLVSGFPPNISLNIGIGRVNSEYDVIASARTDQNGSLEESINIPDFVTPQDQWVIVAAAVNQDVGVVSSPFDIIQE
jgi:hypothetical protein